MTKYEVAYTDENATTTVVGYIARRSASGMLDFIQGSAKAQAIVEALPETVEVTRTPARGWAITDDGRLIGAFFFTGDTERTTKTLIK